ncbi:hypothetical protein BMS3Bbin15_00221 [archaeon BMS3Bbin15]|nr:hypothetical protein BMS3Bbin15_00221 [archaeon BMS3Bbin15]
MWIRVYASHIESLCFAGYHTFNFHSTDIEINCMIFYLIISYVTTLDYFIFNIHKL